MRIQGGGAQPPIWGLLLLVTNVQFGLHHIFAAAATLLCDVGKIPLPPPPQTNPGSAPGVKITTNEYLLSQVLPLDLAHFSAK